MAFRYSQWCAESRSCHCSVVVFSWLQSSVQAEWELIKLGGLWHWFPYMMQSLQEEQHCFSSTPQLCLFIHLNFSSWGAEESVFRIFLFVLKRWVALKEILKAEKESPPTMPGYWSVHSNVQDQIGAVPVDCRSLQRHFEILSWCQLTTLLLFGSHIIYTWFLQSVMLVFYASYWFYISLSILFKALQIALDLCFKSQDVKRIFINEK